MKKKIKVMLLILIIFICVNIIKNIFLYVTYEHENEIFRKIVSNNTISNIEGIWEITYDTYIGGYDERNTIKYAINNDSSGTYTNVFYPNRLFKFKTEPYSWCSLLPFDEKNSDKYECKIYVTSEYFIFIPDSNSFNKDTLYSKYELVNNKLKIDVNKYQTQYSSSPVWLPQSSQKLVSIYQLLYVGLLILK